jgi:hypothetical protein
MPVIRIGSFLVAASLICGCKGEPPTGDVSGTISFDGQPIEQGTITFTPADGKGPTAGGSITAGNYMAPKVPVGTSKVTISGVKSTGKKKMYDDAAAPLVQTSAEMLPPKYSDVKQTTLQYEVVAGSQTKDFKLEK